MIDDNGNSSSMCHIYACFPLQQRLNVYAEQHPMDSYLQCVMPIVVALAQSRNNCINISI